MTARLQTTDDVLRFYRTHSPNTDPGKHASCYDALPKDLPGTCRAVQNLLLHLFWIGEETYGVTTDRLKDAGRQLCVEFSYSTAEERLANVLSLSDAPLDEPRSVMQRSVGCCRDYALMLTSILRHRGIPARVRTGVALYFASAEGRLVEDHYISEHWDAARSRWRMTDPQIDDVQRPAIENEVDPIDLPDGVFFTGWQLVAALRDGRVPETVGFPPRNAGLTYGRNKLFADFASLTGYELPVHAWWGIGEPDSVEPGDETLLDAMIAEIRGIEENDPASLTEALMRMRTHPRLRMPPGYRVPTYRSPLC